MTRFLGIDYGTKRIGLAVSDPGGTLASPLTTLEASGDPAECVRAVIPFAADYEVDAFVVGLPLNMDGSEGPQAKLTRAFGDELAGRTGKQVDYFDERLTTFAADELLRPAELTRQKKRKVQDAVAALVILQGYLDARIADPPSQDGGSAGA